MLHGASVYSTRALLTTMTTFIICLFIVVVFFCRLKRRLFILVLGTIFTYLVIATYVKQTHTDGKSNSESNIVQTNLDWTHSGKEVSSTFNFSLLRRLTSLLTYKKYSKEYYGYVVALRYSGQQGAGIQAMLSLQCWAASFNLPIHILEPTINDTFFVSVPHESLSNKFLRFSDLFDIQHFNRISESIGYVSVGTREDFFASAPRTAVYIHLKLVLKSLPVSEREAKLVWTVGSECKGEECCYQSKDSSTSGRYEEIASLKENFCVIRIIEATYSFAHYYILSDKEVREVIYGDNQQPQHVTVIFSLWRTPWYVPNNELDNPHECKRAGHESSKEQFMPSPRLISDTKYYEKLFLNSSNEVAVMLRIEHMIEYVDQHREQWTVDKCLQEAYRSVTKQRQRFNRPMVTLDMGKFGSGVWSELVTKRGVDINDLTEKSKQLLNSLFKYEWTFEEWEESFAQATGGIENSGYIAALQRTLASRAKCLILVGGGTFQDLALKDYLRIHPKREDQCVHLVCVKNENSFMKVIHSL